MIKEAGMIVTTLDDYFDLNRRIKEAGMIVTKQTLSNFPHLLKGTVKRDLSLIDVELLCRAIIKTIRKQAPEVFLEYEVDLLEPVCYIYADGCELSETIYMRMLVS